ncbi:DEAD/DEAH box helicase [Arthrobacter rhombi]|uniref:DEAD/DEAH box helicase n=1 Tax=Arthrobacter rhombi TaxID=71253 RepID=UPI003FD381AB
MNLAPGSVIRVRDEDWLVTSTSSTTQGILVRVQGLSELVRDTTASFYSGLDDIEVVDPRRATVTADGTPNYRRARLFLETTLRKTPVPATSNRLGVSTRMLAATLKYQQIAVAKALDPHNIRPRILIADAVGLGKTLEIGMILSELVARGRGERILIVTPRHVLEQMQHEMWCRFALPFVRLDSAGIQKVRQKLPATRNPFTYYRRAIISIDTLKSPRYREHLKKVGWDAVVIDESHNLTNTGTLNNELARILAPKTDALILASATPHNGRQESFAELLRLLDPTVVRPDGTVDEQAVRQLIVRRHRHSPEVAREVGADWAERLDPDNRLVTASPAENAIADELASTWLYPEGKSPYSGTTAALFGWTLAKAFLSSPAALLDSVQERLKKVGGVGKANDVAATPAAREAAALERLRELTLAALESDSAKLGALVTHLKEIGVGKNKPMRAVVFAERVATLKYLREELTESLGLKPENIAILHGGLTDVEQQDIVDQFKRGNSKLRVLVTGDVASEGVNLHAECHHLIHFDVPWSLIRIEQRNGRIDRYGQRHSPQITTLLLDPEDSRFSGDISVLARLMEKEHAAHQVLNDVASLMGAGSVKAEEDAIRDALIKQRDLDEVVPDPGTELDNPWAEFESLFDDDEVGDDSLVSGEVQPMPGTAGEVPGVELEHRVDLYATDLAFLEEALTEAFIDPAQKVQWKVHPEHGIAELKPTADLRRRMGVLPQDYLTERRVTENLKLATTRAAGEHQLTAARSSDDMMWPAAHYLGPLHPVLDWASDRALASMSRNEVLGVRGDVDHPTFLVLGTVMNRRGQLVSRAFMAVQMPDVEAPDFALPTAVGDVGEYLRGIGLNAKSPNPGPVDLAGIQDLLPGAVNAAEHYLIQTMGAAETDAESRLEDWLARADAWSHASDALIQRADVRQRRERVAEERQLAEAMRPAQRVVRPLLAILPRNTEVATATQDTTETKGR